MTFLIYDVERSFDEKVCRSSQDVRDTITGADLARSHFIVVEFDTDEGRCRDVTGEFMTDEDEADDAFGIPSPSSLRRWHWSRVA